MEQKSANSYIALIGEGSVRSRRQLYNGEERTPEERRYFCNYYLRKWCAYKIILACKDFKAGKKTQQEVIEKTNTYMNLLIAIKNDPETGFDKFFASKEMESILSRQNESLLYSLNSFKEIENRPLYSNMFAIVKAETELLNAKNYFSPKSITLLNKVTEEHIAMATQFAISVLGDTPSFLEK